MEENQRLLGYIQNLKKRCIEFVEKPRLKEYTTVGIGGKVGVVVEPKSAWQIAQATALAKKWQLKTKIIGGGSNIVGVDEESNLVVVRIGSDFGNIICESEKILVEAGASIGGVQNFALKNNLGGLEKFVGIPATIGGFVAMNGGAFGVSVCDVIESVTVLKNGEQIKILKKDCDFSYRHSRFQNSGEVIVQVVLGLEKRKTAEIIRTTRDFMEIRRNKQPHNVKTFGSVFKNPVGEYAGKLIESVGLKGYREGDCRFSPKHGNFIENLGNGNRSEVNKLIDTAREKVYNIYKIELEQEVLFL